MRYVGYKRSSWGRYRSVDWAMDDDAGGCLGLMVFGEVVLRILYEKNFVILVELCVQS